MSKYKELFKEMLRLCPVLLKTSGKWWEEVKLNYPKIDFVGIEIK